MTLQCRREKLTKQMMKTAVSEINKRRQKTCVTPNMLTALEESEFGSKRTVILTSIEGKHLRKVVWEDHAPPDLMHRRVNIDKRIRDFPYALSFALFDVAIMRVMYGAALATAFPPHIPVNIGGRDAAVVHHTRLPPTREEVDCLARELSHASAHGTHPLHAIAARVTYVRSPLSRRPLQMTDRLSSGTLITGGGPGAHKDTLLTPESLTPRTTMSARKYLGRLGMLNKDHMRQSAR
jgi:hypothetical protein